MKNITLLQAQDWELITIHSTNFTLPVAVEMLEKGDKITHVLRNDQNQTSKFKWPLLYPEGQRMTFLSILWLIPYYLLCIFHYLSWMCFLCQDVLLQWVSSKYVRNINGCPLAGGTSVLSWAVTAFSVASPDLARYQLGELQPRLVPAIPGWLRCFRAGDSTWHHHPTRRLRISSSAQMAGARRLQCRGTPVSWSCFGAQLPYGILPVRFLMPLTRRR